MTPARPSFYEQKVEQRSAPQLQGVQPVRGIGGDPLRVVGEDRAHLAERPRADELADPRHVGPWKCPNRVVTSPCDYAPYFTLPHHPDMARDDPCMSMITVESVFAAVAELAERENESPKSATDR